MVDDTFAQMIRLRKPYILERLVYIVIWLIVFLSPLVIAYWAVNIEAGQTYNWVAIGQMWLYSILPFFILFCLNNFWLAPRLLLRKKFVRYTISVIAILSLFIWFDTGILHKSPVGRFPFGVPEQMMNRQMRQPEERSFTRAPDFRRENPARDRRPLRKEGPEGMRPQPFIGLILMPAIFHILIATLMIGFNIAIKFLFKSIQDEEVMKELERRQLQSELEYLKYQINPHFFMNTLNNIHALVDIDKTQAQKAIVELSKMMRYVLYEANNKTIPLLREILFLNNYIELMKLRYIETVNVKVSLPEEMPEIEIPPLLYISFIENAFKHGVSYRSDSLICVAMQVEESSLVFTCSNTNNGKNEEQHRGIGLDNIQKRLKLLYNDNYTLSITESPESFNVLLIIPLI